MAPINAAFTPHMAHLHHTGDLDGAARAYGTATRWILQCRRRRSSCSSCCPATCSPSSAPATPRPPSLTVVLVVGQVVSAAAGPCGTVLTMSGRVALTMADNLAVLVLDVVLTLVLVPRLGVLGAALAWSTSLVLGNLAKLLQVRTVVGLVPGGRRWGAVALAAVPAAGAALAVRALTDGPLPAALVGGPAVLVVYVGGARCCSGSTTRTAPCWPRSCPAGAGGTPGGGRGRGGTTGRADLPVGLTGGRAGRIP